VSKIKKAAIVIAAFILCATSFAPNSRADESLSMDAMVVPVSPGFVLLGIEPASVERPGTVTDLSFSILNRLQNTNGFPKDFALEIAPYWLFGANNLTYANYANNGNILANVAQTGSISLASASSQDSSMGTIAFGIRFSILRGKIDDEFESYQSRLDSLSQSLKNLNTIYTPYIQQKFEHDELLAALNSAWLKAEQAGDEALMENINAQKTIRQAEIKTEIDKDFADSLIEIRKLASNLRFRRIGWKLDIAGGTVTRFPNQVFNSGKMSRWGCWATGGYEWKNWSALAVVRYLGDKIQNNLSSLDMGGRLIIDVKKLSLSVEIVSRNFPNSSSQKNVWRFAEISDYAIAKNKSLSLTVGRDFGGNYSGSLITLLNLLLGFGSNRPIR
jgi:hypothetical protein